jgi:hypothetical protein
LNVDAFYKVALELLREMKMSSSAIFRTPLQSTAVVSSLQRKEMLYIGPCGIGKSNIFLIPLFVEKRTTVLFMPYALVRRNIQLTVESMNITSMLLEMGTSRIDFSNPPRLLVCAVEQIREISGILFELSKREMLARIVIDEIQCLFTEAYRCVMGEKDSWRAQLAVGVPLMFLSGSFRKCWEKSFEECMGTGISILREDTVVPSNFTYSVAVHPDHAGMYDFTLACYSDILSVIARSPSSSQHFKCMVFVPLVSQVSKIISAMKERFQSNPVYATVELVGYTSQDSNESQMQAYQKWLRGSGVASIFVCTHAGAVGIDPPPKVKVYHLEAVWSIVSYFQATGRSGRGSWPGQSLFITSKKAISEFLTKYKIQQDDAADILEYVLTTSCKRRWLSWYFDSMVIPPCSATAGACCSSCLVTRDGTSARLLLQTSAIPPDPCTALRDTASLSAAFSRGDQIVSLIRIFSSFKEKDWCGLCYIFSNVRLVHKLHLCPLMCTAGKLVCFRCAGNHVSSCCHIVSKFPQGQVCFTCGCNFKVSIFDLHSAGSTCDHGAKDRLLISCWYAKRNQIKLSNTIKSKFATGLSLNDDAYAEWMMQRDQETFLWNSLKLFGEMMEWSFRINPNY